MVTLLQQQTNNVFSNIPNGLPTLNESSHLWLSPLNIPQNGKDSLIQSQRKQNEKTEQNSHTIRETGPHASPARNVRRSSKPPVSREKVSPERARRLERNRIAANKCRIKKKKEHESIQSVLHSAIAKRQTLIAEVNVLKEEVWQLKNRMFEHANCDDQRINLQLAKMAQNVLGAKAEAVKCSTPTFSISTWSDGSVGDEYGDNGGMESGAVENVAEPVPDFQDGLFESFIDLRNM